jgi:hypothetical protein
MEPNNKALEITSLDNLFKEDDCYRIFTNRNKNQIAFVGQEHTIVISPRPYFEVSGKFEVLEGETTAHSTFTKYDPKEIAQNIHKAIFGNKEQTKLKSPTMKLKETNPGKH